MRIDSSNLALEEYRSQITDPFFVGEPVLSGIVVGPDEGEMCKCGMWNNPYGYGCSVVKPNSRINGSSKFYVYGGLVAACETEAACRANYGEYLDDTGYWCPNGWVFKNEND